jgi:glutathione peroxidase
MPSAHDFTAKTIRGDERKLSEYAGQVLLVVNVASECGLTPQYRGLEELQRKYRDRGLRVVGFPANEFGGQEPGSNEEIAQFCTSKFDVSFDMMAKVVVKGDGIHPLFQWLTSETGGDIKWNFGKFLIGKDGAIVKRFEPTVAPDSPELVAAIEKALG